LRFHFNGKWCTGLKIRGSVYLTIQLPHHYTTASPHYRYITGIAAPLLPHRYCYTVTPHCDLGFIDRSINSDARRRRLRPGGATSQAPGRRPDLGRQARRCLSPTLWTAPLSIGRVRRAPQIRLTARVALAQPGPLAQEHRPALAAGAVFRYLINKSPRRHRRSKRSALNRRRRL
jgi:hypothetical protein